MKLEENFKGNNLDEILKNINKKIFDEKVWIGEKMRKIAEVTYSYKNFSINGEQKKLNYTLFSEIGELDFENLIILEDSKKIEKILEAKNTLIKKIKYKKNSIFSILKDLEDFKTKNNSEKIKKEIIKNSLKEKIYLFDYCLNGLTFELEKAGIKEKNRNTKKINKKLEKLDKKLFGGKVSKNTNEVNLCYNILTNEFEENQEKLNKNEQEKYKYFLKKIEKKFNYLKLKKIEKPENNLEKYNNIFVRDINYIPVFNIFLEIQGLIHKAVQNNEAGSISDGPNIIEFPTSENFKELTIPRILRLNSHEIESHSINDQNSKKILGNIRGAGSIEKEEGLAILMENMLDFGDKILDENNKINLEKCKIPENLALILAGELFSPKELKQFLELKYKFGNSKSKPEDIFLRLKRSNKDGVQHKDTTYSRGFIKIVGLLNSGKIDFFDLFLGKFGISDLGKIKKIVEDEKIKILKPFFNSDRILYIFETGDSSEKGFLDFLQNKYNFIDFSNLKIEGQIKETNEKIHKIITKIKDLRN